MPRAAATLVANWPEVPTLYGTYVGHELSTEPSLDLYGKSNTDLRRMVLVSDFLSTVEQSITVQRQIDQLRSLRRGWNTYGAEPPNDTAFELTDRILSAANRLRIDVTRVVPSADGGLGVCFVRGGRYAHIEASNEGELTLVMFAGRETAEVSGIDSEESLLRALERIRDYTGQPF